MERFIRKKDWISIALFLGILVFFCFTYYHDMLFRMPYALHTWAQSDRLSLAINFYDNGMNFFKPATHNLYSRDGITGVEFPIQSYLAAIGGKILGRQHISFCFRLLDTIISCVGLLFLFLAAYKATKDFLFSIVTPLFIFCTPIFIYYTCNYLPDTAAASLAFISFYFILNYLDTPRNKDLLVAIGLLTLAALIKTSVGLYLIGFMAYVFFQRVLRRYHYKRRDNVLFVAACVISLSLLFGYMLYNRYLNKTYHSDLFLANINPFRSWDDVRNYFDNNVKHIWLQEYFVLPQYLLFVAAVAGAIPLLRSKREGNRRIIMLLIFVAGVLGVATLMGRQLVDHDYYAVSIFQPLFAFALLISVVAIRKSLIIPQGLFSFRIAVLAIVLVQFFFADFHIHKRLEPGYGGYSPKVPWAEHGAALLDRLGVGPKEAVVVLNEDDPNTYFVYLDRKGYNIRPGYWNDIRQVKDSMNKWGLVTLICEEQLGRGLFGKDSVLKNDFNALALENRMAVFQIKSHR